MESGNLKKIIALLLVACMSVPMTGCSSSDNSTAVVEESNDSESQESSETSETETQNEENESTASSSESMESINESQENIVESSENDTSETTASETSDLKDDAASSAVESSAVSDESETESTVEVTTSQAEPETVSVTEESETTSQQEESVQSPATDPSADEELSEIEEMDSDELTTSQRNAINMLNYMTVLTQEINDSKQSRVFLDNSYDSLINNIYPNAVDTKTQSQITSLLDTLHQYQMISVKRERLQYIYEQNQAQALRQAIPNPIGLLSAVQSGDYMKLAASVLYMAVDSVTSYESASTQADLEYLKDNWELDDEEQDELHNSTKTLFNYMLNMCRENDLPGDYALNENSVEEFVKWKNATNLVRKIDWLESNQETYQEFGPYWLELAKDYYDSEDYLSCLDAFENYEEVTTRIFREDTDYATALPMAIISAKNTMTKVKYNEYADQYAQVILNNTGDWATRYFVAQVYLDLYKNTKDESYLDKAYKIIYDNVNELVDEQKELNETYLADIQEVQIEKGATKEEKSEIKQYNKMLKETRKTELPPVSEALYLNCDFLFDLIEERGISAKEQSRVDAILHENGDNIFLTTALDNQFRFEDDQSDFDTSTLDVEFDGDGISIPASCLTDTSAVSVVVSGTSGKTTIDDWKVEKVERPKDADVSEFMVTLTSKTAKKYKYADGDEITVSVVTVADSSDEKIDFVFEAVQGKKLVVLNDIKFERK